MFCAGRRVSVLIHQWRWNHYKLLGIERAATDKEIKSAYLAQAKKLHPDANQTDPNAQQHFQKLQEAYNVLKDTQAKWEYDRTLDPPRNTTASHSNATTQQQTHTEPTWEYGKTSQERQKERYDPWDYSKQFHQQSEQFWRAAMESEYGDPNHNFGSRQHWRYYETNFDQDADDADYWPRKDFKRPPNERQYDDTKKESAYGQYRFEAEQAQFRRAWENMRAQQEYRDNQYDGDENDPYGGPLYDDDQFENPFYDYWDQKEAFYEDINGERAAHYRNMWNEVHDRNSQFRPGNNFFGAGARGPQSHDDFYEREHVNNWQQNMGWKEARAKPKRKKGKKKQKKKKEKFTAETDKVAEFYSKLARNGGGEVVIDGKVHTVKMRNGELIIKPK